MHLDVTVTSALGQPVLGLKAEDFRVLDNGQPAKLVSFHPYGEGGDPPVAITLVLDTLRVQNGVEGVERELVRRFLRENDGHLAQPISLVLLTDTGLWRVGQPSADGKALEEALVHNHVTSWNGETLVRADDAWVRSQVSGIGTPGGLQHYTPYVAVRPPAESGLRALGAIAADARGRPGRKLLIWVGPGWGAGSAGNPEEVARTNQEKKAAFDKIVWFSTLLRLGRVSLCNYAGTTAGSAVPGSWAVGENGLQPSPVLTLAPSSLLGAGSPQQLNGRDQESIAELNRRVLAVESGGETVEADGGDAAAPINRCIRDAHAAYTLTFDPASAGHADEYHSLRVEVRDGRATVRSNSGYYDEPYYTDASNPAIRKVTVAELDQAVKAGESEPDGDLARQLAGMELTERTSEARIAAWSEALRGKKAREALTALADSSAFLDPPAEEVDAAAPPDRDTQLKMIALAADYLKQTMPRLPNFFARRTATNYTEIPLYYHGGGKVMAAEPLHAVDTTRTTVLFRDGAEVVDAKVLEREKRKGSLSTYGTFGPVLGAVKTALARGVVWRRWEKDANAEGGRRAVFGYTVPAAFSRAEIRGCCLPEGEGTTGFLDVGAYHGEIAIDPGSGAVLRVAVEQNLQGFVPADRADLMVAYGPVTIDDRKYICPVRSVSRMRMRSVNTATEWDSESFLEWGPYATVLNDFRFDDYHLFRAKIRMLPGVTPASD
jgi:VWFA-related protein